MKRLCRNKATEKEPFRITIFCRNLLINAKCTFDLNNTSTARVLVLVAAKEQRDRQKPPTGEVEGEDRGEGLGGGADESKSVETGIQTNNML